MEINVKKIFLLVIDKDQKRRKETPAPELEINGERVQTMNLFTCSTFDFVTFSLFHYFIFSLLMNKDG